MWCRQAHAVRDACSLHTTKRDMLLSVRHCCCGLQDLADMTRINNELRGKLEKAMEQLIAAQTAKEHAREKVCGTLDWTGCRVLQTACMNERRAAPSGDAAACTQVSSGSTVLWGAAIHQCTPLARAPGVTTPAHSLLSACCDHCRHMRSQPRLFSTTMSASR